MLLAVVGWGMSRGAKEALIWGIVGGMSLDLFGGGPLGVSVLALLPIALMSGVGETKLMENNLTISFALVFIGTILYNTIFLLLLQLLGNHVEWWLSFLTLFLPAALLNTLLMPFAYWLFRWLAGKTRPSGGVELSKTE
jgi:rod shape-determining protein MreD